MSSTRGETAALWAVLALCVAAAVACFIQIYAGTQTTREAILLSLLLTIASISASWIFTHIYAQRASREKIQEIQSMHHENLRLFGLKAAEKVFNLSNEIARLEEYVMETIEDRNDGDPETALRISDERLSGIRHSLVTLRSINDRSLSDWEGVIGEELKQKQQEFKEYEDEMSDLVHRIEELDSRFEDQDMVKQQLAQIQKEMKNISVQLPSTYIFGGVRTPRKIKLSCPECGHDISVKMNRRGQVRYRGVRCTNCLTSWICVPTDEGSAQLLRRKEVEETEHCPVCGHLNEFKLDNIIGAFKTIQCTACSANLHASRSGAGIILSIRSGAEETSTAPTHLLPEEFINQVQALLPPQPWPKNAHKDVAEKLNVPAKNVQKAIQVLIARGIVFNQVDGKIMYDLSHEVATGSESAEKT